MSILTDRLVAQKEKKAALAIFDVIIGSIFLALLAQIAVPLPFNPVPMTLQTLGVFLIGITLGKKKAPVAVALYLGQACMGLPVLANGAINPLCLLGPTGGYLIGFMIAAYAIAWVYEKKTSPTFLWTVFSIVCGQAVIYFLGISVLSCYVGFKNSILFGIVPFIPTMIIKVLLAASTRKGVQFLRAK